MDTLNKLRIARALYKTVKTARACVGIKGDEVLCSRNGVRWNLDLSEGIDLSIYLFGQFERSTSQAIRSLLFPGAVVFDIGANVGALALPMANQVGEMGRVYAIEPTSWAFSKLSKNLDLNPKLAKTLLPFQMMLTDLQSNVPQNIYSSWKLEQGETHPIHGGRLNSVKGAQVTSLDLLVEKLGVKKVDLIKLDVDGFELKVLRGATQVLSRIKPKIILEVTPYTLEEQNDSLEALIEFLYNANYRLFTENGKSEISMDAKVLRQRIPALGGINVLACPEE